jgi:ketopantoate hydroxymethyltransferase
MHARGEKIVMLTADVATFAAVAEAAGVECLLAGDSLGMVCRTPSACRSTRCANTESVARGLRRTQGTAWLIADLPLRSQKVGTCGSVSFTDKAFCSVANTSPMYTSSRSPAVLSFLE